MEAEEALLVCSAAIVVLGSAVPKKRGRKRRWWHTELFKKRCGNELLMDLKFQEISGQ
jgi:hypothetical protein